MTSETAYENKTEKVSVLKEKSLKAAGYAYLLGDAAFATAKFMENDRAGAYGAGLWAVGGLAAARYGSPSAEKELELLQRRLGEYLKKQGVKIPHDPTTTELAKPNGVIHHIESFLYEHPSQMLNAVYTLGGALTLKGGIVKNNRMDVASGVLITAGALAGLLIPEKQPDAENPATTALGKLKEWAQAKPLRVSGTLYHLNNISMVFGAYHQIGKNRIAGKGSQSHLFRFLTAASYIFANTMLSLSSKAAGTSSNADEDEITLAALAQSSAVVISAQPKEIQEALVQQISGYLAAQPQINKKPQEIAAVLNDKLATVKIPKAEGWVARTRTISGELAPAR